jgi:hypothetical protein
MWLFEKMIGYAPRKLLLGTLFSYVRSQGVKMPQEVLDNANEIMNEAVDKAGELLCTKPHIAEIVLKQLLRCDPEHLSGFATVGAVQTPHGSARRGRGDHPDGARIGPD